MIQLLVAVPAADAGGAAPAAAAPTDGGAAGAERCGRMAAGAPPWEAGPAGDA